MKIIIRKMSNSTWAEQRAPMRPLPASAALWAEIHRLALPKKFSTRRPDRNEPTKGKHIKETPAPYSTGPVARPATPPPLPPTSTAKTPPASSTPKPAYTPRFSNLGPSPAARQPQPPVNQPPANQPKPNQPSTNQPMANQPMTNQPKANLPPANLPPTPKQPPSSNLPPAASKPNTASPSGSQIPAVGKPGMPPAQPPNGPAKNGFSQGPVRKQEDSRNPQSDKSVQTDKSVPPSGADNRPTAGSTAQQPPTPQPGSSKNPTNSPIPDRSLPVKPISAPSNNPIGNYPDTRGGSQGTSQNKPANGVNGLTSNPPANGIPRANNSAAGNGPGSGNTGSTASANPRGINTPGDNTSGANITGAGTHGANPPGATNGSASGGVGAGTNGSVNGKAGALNGAGKPNGNGPDLRPVNGKKSNSHLPGQPISAWSSASVPLQIPIDTPLQQPILRTNPKPQPDNARGPLINRFQLGLERLLKQHPNLPAETAVIGVCEDGLPVLLDLNDPTPGALAVISDGREGQLDLLRTAVSSMVSRNSPSTVQFLVFSCQPETWQTWNKERKYERFCLDVVNVEDEDLVRDWIVRLADWTEQRRLGQRSGPPVLLVMDSISFLPRLAYDIRLNFDWMAREGPAARIWPIATISTDLATALGARLLRAFQSRIMGYAADPAIYMRFANLSEKDAASFGQPGQFAIQVGEEWLRFRLPGG